MATTEYGSGATLRFTFQAAMKGGLNVETLAGTFTMTSKSATFQVLDPGGASRNVVLPGRPSYGPFLIQNAADATENLVVKDSDGSTTVATLYRGQAAWFVYDTEAGAYVAVDRHDVYGGAGIFLSTEQTGTGSAQNVAHGFGVTPSKVFAIPSDITGGAYTVAYGTHDATNCVVTVTTGEKYRVVAHR